MQKNLKKLKLLKLFGEFMDTATFMYNGKTKFLRYQHGIAYYALPVPYSKMLYSFPVPINDLKDGLFEAEAKTISFIKYIDKAIQEGTLCITSYQASLIQGDRYEKIKKIAG